jgi:hypothetical protein
MLGEATLAYGRRAMRALLGVDALYRAESGDGDGLAVVNLDTAGEYRPESFAGYEDARRCFGDLRRDAAGLPEPDRCAYYDALCHSTLAFVRWRTEGLSFKSQLQDLLHASPEPASEAELNDLRAQMQRLLERMGYRGELASQSAAWEERNRVPPEAVPDVLGAFLSEAWDRTERSLFPIPAPKTDGMNVFAVSGAAFNARCDYLRRRVEINTDPVLTRPGLKHLAVHEGYPGHYVQFKMRETLARAGRAPADVLLSVVNTASSSVFEGIGDSGLALLDWMENGDDELQALMNRYRAGIGTGAAWRLHALGWPEEHVRDWLQARCLIGGNGWVANRLRFIAEPARAVLVWSYWWGERVVTGAWKAVEPERRSEYLGYLYGRMHSNATVGMWERGNGSDGSET